MKIYPEKHNWHEETDYLLGQAENLARTDMNFDEFKIRDFMGEIEKTIKILRAMLDVPKS